MLIGYNQKAYIQKVGGERIPCLFNPTEYTIMKKNQWKKADTGGSKDDSSSSQQTKKHSDAPQLDFGGGGSEQLKVKLFFDTTGPYHEKVMGFEDVRRYTDKVFSLMKISGETPPLCKFIWGGYVSPPSVIMSIRQKFLMFRRDGTPIRAELQVKFQEQHQEQKKQNPTSVGAARRTRLVHGGDRLDLIAFQEFGDSTRWIEIAQMNNLLSPLDLRPGQILRIPLK